MQDFYEAIFKRKSFHLFRGCERPLNSGELAALRGFIAGAVPLYPDIKFRAELVPESDTTCARGAEYCILLYSEDKPGSLQNIGYIGEQLDLYLAAAGIGALWYGMGKPKAAAADGMEYVIMLAIAKMPPDKFRRDMFKSKRKPLEEIWQGDTLRGIGGIVRFAPSACNTQPWLVKAENGSLAVSRRTGKRGIMPAARISYYNRIDIGIFLLMLEQCLGHDGVKYQRELYCRQDSGDNELAVNAVYKIITK